MGTHSALSEPSAIEEAQPAFISSTLDPPALNDEPAGGDAEPSLVGCQFASTEDARQFVDPEDADMRRASNEKSKPFQSKLTLTLRNPETGRKSPSRPATPQPRVALKHQEPRLKTFAPQPSTSTGNLFNNSTDIPESKTLPRLLGKFIDFSGPVENWVIFFVFRFKHKFRWSHCSKNQYDDAENCSGASSADVIVSSCFGWFGTCSSYRSHCFTSSCI